MSVWIFWPQTMHGVVVYPCCNFPISSSSAKYIFGFSIKTTTISHILFYMLQLQHNRIRMFILSWNFVWFTNFNCSRFLQYSFRALSDLLDRLDTIQYAPFIRRFKKLDGSISTARKCKEYYRSSTELTIARCKVEKRYVNADKLISFVQDLDYIIIW